MSLLYMYIECMHNKDALIKDPMLEAAKRIQHNLDLCGQHKPQDWAELFVTFKMWFHREFSRGLICSTEHGIDYFEHVRIGCEEGTKFWTEKGEYGDNFRKMIKERPLNETK